MDQDPKISFTHSRQLLERLSRLSPQARRYHEILHHFGDAVERYERQRRREHPPSGPSYLERILKPDADADGRPSAQVPAVAPANNGQYTAPDGAIAGPCPVESGADERFLWPQQTDMLFAPEISDELGMQLPWDEYVSQFTEDVHSRMPWDSLNSTLNPE
ncbi:hypothetical protein IMZ48_23590 [Candidatus Bathyarchaeota archaeon]|nr:hypothetical protein [Candidatus Bathyarchaeota archaeon]